MKRALLLLAFAVVLLAKGAAAQGRPELTSRTDADVVAVGDELHLFLQAMAGDTLPTDPSPGSTKGFQVEGMSSGPSQSISVLRFAERSSPPASISSSPKRWP